MPNYTNITVAGYVGRDAESKQVGDSTVVEFSVAVTTKRREESTAWYRCAIWGKRGQSLLPHITKGSAVIVGGELMPREYTGRNDELRTSLDINVQSFAFAGGGRKSDDAPDSHPSDKGHYEDDVPF